MSAPQLERPATASRDGWTWAGLTVVAAAAAVLSFDALRALAEACGLGRLGWLLPVAIDAAAVVATRVWLSGHAGPSPARYARAVALAALGLSVAGNAAQHFMAAYRLAPVWWVVVAVSAVPPVLLGAVAHLAALMAADRARAATRVDTAAETGADPASADRPDPAIRGRVPEPGPTARPGSARPAPVVESPEGGMTPNGDRHTELDPQAPRPGRGSPPVVVPAAPPVPPGLSVVPGHADARVVRLAQLLRAGEQLTGKSAGAAVGTSERTGRRLLRDAEQLLANRPRGLRETATR